MTSEHVTLVEVGPRDGLQNEKTFIPTDQKITLINALTAAGFSRIEATSFVSPKWVPQLSDAMEVMAKIDRAHGTAYSVLTPNLRGFEAAIAAKADEVAIFGAASETFSQKNINCTIAESLDRFRPVAEAARAQGIPMRGYVSCVIECPYEGAISPDAVARVAAALVKMGCHEISLGDTVGKGKPETVAAMLDAVLGEVPAERLAGHYHDTNGRAVESIEVSLEKGLRVFDSAIGGLGGCPYAPGAKGNVDTLKVHNAVMGLGYQTDLDMERLEYATKLIREILNAIGRID